jgi:hypothetical protein
MATKAQIAKALLRKEVAYYENINADSHAAAQWFYEVIGLAIDAAESAGSEDDVCDALIDALIGDDDGA